MAEKPILFQGDMARATFADLKTETRRVINKRFRFNDDPDKYFVFYSGYADSDTPGVKEPGHYVQFADGTREDPGFYDLIKCPYGQVGDRLWVRETFKVGAWRDSERLRIAFDYRASPELVNTPWCYPPTSKDYTNQILKAVYELDKKGIEPEGGGPERIYKWEAGKSPLKWKPSIFMPRWASRITLEITEIKVERVQDITEAGAIAEGVDAVSMADHPRQATMSRKADFKQLWDSINKKRGYGWDLNPLVWVIKYKRIEK